MLKTIGKLAATPILALGLAGCIDVDVDVAITSPTTAKATMVQTMGADFYAMAKMSAESGEAGEDGFCAEGTLAENADGSATCTVTEEGPFAELDLGQEEGGMRFASAGPGLVRVSLPTADLKRELGGDEQLDEETMAMVEAFFTDRTITITISGEAVTDTNMELADDGKSASQDLPMIDLIKGTLDVPDELFAVVRAP